MKVTSRWLIIQDGWVRVKRLMIQKEKENCTEDTGKLEVFIAGKMILDDYLDLTFTTTGDFSSEITIIRRELQKFGQVTATLPKNNGTHPILRPLYYLYPAIRRSAKSRFPAPVNH